MDFIAEIKNRLRIEDIISPFIELQRTGKNIKGLCPFHNEKTPSFMVDINKQYFKCFGCSEHGDIIDFYYKFYRIDKKTAVKELAAKAGITNSDFHRRPAPIKRKRQFTENILGSLTETEKEIYLERNAIAGEKIALKEIKKKRLESNREVFEEFYCYCLAHPNKAAFNYLKQKRKIQPSLAEKFKIFTINNYYEVNNHLKKKFPLQQLQKSGLYNDKGNMIFWKHRIIIPYLYGNNWTIYYLRGRYFDENGNYKTDSYKYLGLADDALHLNSPKRFFNQQILLKMFDFENLFLTEGEFDTIIMDGLGRNAVGIPGAGNIPPFQKFHLIKKYKIYYIGDNDAAGNELLNGHYKDKNGVEKYKEDNLTEYFRRLNKRFKIKFLEDSKDINDFVINHGIVV